MNTHQHHPGEAWLLDYALGNLPECFETVIGAHVQVCEHCRESIAAAEVFGGELLAGAATAPLTLTPDAIAWRTEADDTPVSPASRAVTVGSRDSFDYFVTTYLKCSADALPWKRLGKGLQICLLNQQLPYKIWMLRAAPGTVLPRHTHAGSELTLVMKGAYFCGADIFRAGDIEDADEETLHQPVVTGDSECICLAVTDGNLRFEGWLPRLLQPFVGI